MLITENTEIIVHPRINEMILNKSSLNDFYKKVNEYLFWN